MPTSVPTVRVGVVVPVHNAARYLTDTLQSVLAQTYPNWECVVVDDGSTDGSDAVAGRFAEADERIRCVVQANAGVSTARNNGVAALSAEVGMLAFLDADDIWLPTALEQLVAALVADRYAVGVYGLAEYIDAAGLPVQPGRHPAGQRDRRVMGRFDLTGLPPEAPATFSSLLVVHTMWPAAVVLHRRRAFQAVGGFDPSFRGSEDWDLHLRMTRLGHYLALDRQVAWYRRHETNLTGDQRFMIGQNARVRRRAWESTHNTAAQRRAAVKVARRLAARWTVWAAAAGAAAVRRGRLREAVRAVGATAFFAGHVVAGRPLRPSEWTTQLEVRYVMSRTQGAGGELP